MEYRIHIDLTQGIIEASGSEEFVASVFEQFKARLTEVLALPRAVSTPGSAKAKISGGTAKKAKTKKGSRSSSAEPHPLVKDLDLSGGSSGIILRDFYAGFTATNAMQKNLIFAVYLRDHVGLDAISADHIYTCWRNVNERVPKHFNQSIRDAASKKGWLDTGDLSNITISTQGFNGTEHDIPKMDAEEGNGD